MAITVSVLQGGTNSHQTTSEEVNYFATDFVTQGVVGTVTSTSGVAPMTGTFAINAQGTPDMTVAVSSGIAYVTATPTSGNSQILRVKNTTSSNVTISSNSTGGTRFDWVYIKIDPDKAKDPAVGATDVATLVTSRSTSATTDNGTPPTYGYAIAVVTVANGASSITNGNIADSRGLAVSTVGTTLGYAEITSNFTTTTGGSMVDITNLSVRVNVPLGGRRIKITGFCTSVGSSQAAGNGVNFAIRESSTTLAAASHTTPVASYQETGIVMYSTVATAGVHTYKLSAQQVTNTQTLTVTASATAPAFILVELI
jgi:hypothetical protein